MKRIKITPNNVADTLIGVCVIGGPLLVIIGGPANMDNVYSVFGYTLCLFFTLTVAITRYANNVASIIVNKYDEWSTDRLVKKWDSAEKEEYKIKL